MRVLHINNTDLPGARFNGYSLLRKQEAYGIDVHQIVLDKYSDSPKVRSIKLPGNQHQLISAYEDKSSIRCLSFPYTDLIIDSPEFQKADIVHYHLLHNEMVSLFDLPRLFSRKTCVWTIHDPWILTGHCVYPLSCKKYLEGCGDCPDLKRHFAIKNDTTAFMWKVKESIFKQLRIPLIVASDWMEQLIRNHPFGEFFPVIKKIPFGIDLSIFKPCGLTDKVKLREKNDIPNKFTIFFRQDPSPFKGLRDITEALKNLNIKTDLNIVTVGTKGLLDPEIYNNFFVKEMGWLNSEKDLAEIYQLSDVFLMPSTAESFGVMGIEALASGIPLITRENTAVADITGKGETSLLFKDVNGIRKHLEELILSEEYYKKISDKSRELAIKEFSEELYHQRLVDFYDSLLRDKLSVR